MTTDNKPPARAFRLTLAIDADTRAGMASTLQDLARRIESYQVTTGLWGSPTDGGIYELLYDPSMTHDAYHAQLRAYLDRSAEARSLRTGVVQVSRPVKESLTTEEAQQNSPCHAPTVCNEAGECRYGCFRKGVQQGQALSDEHIDKSPPECDHIYHALQPLPNGCATAKCIKCGYEPSLQGRSMKSDSCIENAARLPANAINCSKTENGSPNDTQRRPNSDP